MNIKDDTRRTRETSFGWMIQRIAGALDRNMNARLAELDMQIPAFAVMMTVLEHGPLTQTDIGKNYGMAAYTISRALDTLENLGYVERRAHASSRRAHSIQTTQAGREIAPRLHAIVREVNHDLTAVLSKVERENFGDVLKKLTTDWTSARK